MLKQRIITGVTLAAGVLLAIFLMPADWLAVLFGVIVIAAAWEFANLAGLESRHARAAYSLLVMAVLLLASQYAGLVDGVVHRSNARDLLGIACAWWAISLLWVMGYPGSAALWGSRAARCVIGLLVLVPAWLGIVVTRLQAEGEWLIVLMLLLVIAADVGAYFAGRRFGKAKLAPAVSPGKSWAGFWGGLFSSLSVAALAWWFWPGGMQLSWQAMMAIALFTALASVLGDLVESMVKRHRGIKDSGTILPGHGGIMDRLDSISAALPVFALGLLLAGGV